MVLRFSMSHTRYLLLCHHSEILVYGTTHEFEIQYFDKDILSLNGWYCNLHLATNFFLSATNFECCIALACFCGINLCDRIYG